MHGVGPAGGGACTRCHRGNRRRNFPSTDGLALRALPSHPAHPAWRLERFLAVTVVSGKVEQGAAALRAFTCSSERKFPPEAPVHEAEQRCGGGGLDATALCVAKPSGDPATSLDFPR